MCSNGSRAGGHGIKHFIHVMRTSFLTTTLQCGLSHVLHGSHSVGVLDAERERDDAPLLQRQMKHGLIGQIGDRYEAIRQRTRSAPWEWPSTSWLSGAACPALPPCPASRGSRPPALPSRSSAPGLLR